VNSVCAPPALRPVTRRETGLVAPDETVADRQVRRPATAWPLMSHLELAALPTAAGSARKHARAVTLEFGLSALAGNIELIVSELVTNGVRASEYLRDGGLATPVVRLWLASDLQCVLIRVWDASTEMPVRRDAGPDDESGRGLMLVSCLGSEWGAYRKANGKVVWVIVR
jgi:anti-sigma regulatory factor (Ser/Thr protein kinase)